MNLKEEFKKETGLETVIEDGIGNSFYTEDYVEWLENRVEDYLYLILEVVSLLPRED